MKTKVRRKKLTVHDKAIRLLEGGFVEIDSNLFSLRKFPNDYDGETCVDCDLDSICRMEHTVVCVECEAISRRKCCLQLAGCNR